ncbi:hypothetical protein OED01_09605 [Microbacterium sp. M28]|uniref:hypothetical protein n=1 Tax=Microbacterium sp. M28 TaxID=2962064 RepID=UPI0021F430CC|nr:hypothetical protein [Microbacterium sp. M28]UYO95864.1 hypothetical protein OED01_09605 [Microbacterium sp. M28]
MRDDALDIGTALPGVFIRIALFAVVGGGAWLLHPGIGWQVIAVAAVAGGAAWPQTGLAWFATIVVPFALITQPVDLGRTCLAVLVVHLGHVLATLSLTVPIRSRIALRALRPTALRLLLVQSIAQIVAVVAVLLPSAEGRGIAWLAPIGALAVVGVAVVLLRHVRR